MCKCGKASYGIVEVQGQRGISRKDKPQMKKIFKIVAHN